MTQSPIIKNILSEIEFEIAQGIVSHEDLGPCIEAVKQFQNKIRTKTFKSLKITDKHREILSRQFQTIDMLISLLQETALVLQSMQHDIKQLRQLPPITSQFSDAIFPKVPQELQPVSHEELAISLEKPLEIKPSDEIENAIKPEAIQVDLQARPIRWPVIGRLLTKLKIWYQRPALFYTQIFASRQAPVNQVLGDRILYLESFIQAQQGQIEALKSQLESPPD